ncbi:hypothetical protein [Kitasatospora mediocidica]|uniref:hypothetical protein n=1 Tax=Kitasatospora mediocidica TaxID=58352 RepID=UPI0012FAFD9C|nr:hypothetical protein [Kitasatospora mediocidica]
MGTGVGVGVGVGVGTEPEAADPISPGSGGALDVAGAFGATGNCVSGARSSPCTARSTVPTLAIVHTNQISG